MSKMNIRRWRFFDEFGCVKLDPKTLIPIPGADGQPQLQRFPMNLEIGDKVGSMFGGIEVMDSEYDRALNGKVIMSLMHHAERIAPFAEFIVAPAFKVFDISGLGALSDEGTAELYEMQDQGLFYRTRVALLSAGRDTEATRERFWKALMSTVSKEKGFLDEIYEHKIERWSDIGLAFRGCDAFVRQILSENSSRLAIAIERGEIRAEHVPRLRAEHKIGKWKAFSYLWSVYADLACETLACGKDFAAPHPEAEDHLWFFYRVFYGVEGEKIAKLVPGPWYRHDDMRQMRANFLAPSQAQRVPVKPMEVRPLKATG